MEENHHHHHHQFNHQRTTTPSRLGLRTTVGGGGGGGEIVEVHGGHIVRSTGRKDRHSKVCTAKGPRDRRVRLAAHTAIQFYDVQDRLGFDRPSKAVDWLIKKAQSAIDELAELPPWKPTGGSSPIVDIEQNPNDETLNYHRLSQLEEHQDDDIVGNHMGDVQNSSFLPASIDSIKSFFPSSPMNNNGSSGAQFHHSFSSRNEDLKLSLHSFQGDNNIYYDGSGWPETGPETGPENGGFSGFMFNSPAIPTTAFLQPLIGKPTNGQWLNYISQRGPLQSSNTPPVRAGVEPLQFTGAVVDPHQTLGFHHPMPGFTSGVGGLSVFDVPARIRGDEEEQDGLSDKPSSASSDSRH